MAVIFCKSQGFLGETADTLKSHISFINTVFGVNLHKKGCWLNTEWFVSPEHPHLLYMSGHTGDAIKVLNCLHVLCDFGVGTQINEIYLNTCSSKPEDEVNKNVVPEKASPIILPSEATEEEKKLLGITKPRFVTLDIALKNALNDKYKIYICHQEIVSDYKVKMAHFLPMDECGLGFSPTKSELILYNHKGNLSEKLRDAFDEINEEEI
jgi:hypothetical protein